MICTTPSDFSIEQVSPESLKANPHNARTHSRRQARQIAASVREFGFLNPIIADKDGSIVAGHGRFEAAKLVGLTRVPVIRIEHLSPDQIRAYIIADNKLAELAGWDKSILAVELQHFMTDDVSLDVTVTGFELPEIDLILEGEAADRDKDDSIDAGENQPPVSRLGDAWHLGQHAIVCADALEPSSYAAVLNGRSAAMVFADPPYYVRVDGHATGKGRIRHREFPMASGEMDADQYQDFLGRSASLLAANSKDGSLHYICMDWSHSLPLLAAGAAAYDDLKNICVWIKNNGGMGSFYRSQHELVFVFKKGSEPHRNNIQLGRFGRNRTNAWSYPSPSAFSRSGEEGHLAALHPTVKPVAMVADAILDCTARGEIVLDSFIGSGTTLIAAERVGRICCGIELDPLYVDVAIRRWQRHTGDVAVHSGSGKHFDDLAREAAHV